MSIRGALGPGVEIPESDYGQLSTVARMADVLARKASTGGESA